MSFAIKFACALVALGVITSAQSSIAPRRLRLPATSYRYVDEKMPRSFQTWPGDNTPADNQLTDAGAALGRVLFYDTQLSGNNTRACASCHLQQHAFADPPRQQRLRRTVDRPPRDEPDEPALPRAGAVLLG